MKSYVSWLIPLSGWLVVGCASSLKLSSAVVDKATGKPVQGYTAMAKLVDKNDTVLDSAVTMSDGKFLIKAPQLNKSEAYRVVVTIPYLSDGVTEVVHQDRKPPIVPEIRLPVLSGLVGVVTDGNDAPIISAMVRLALPDAGPEDVIDETESGPGGEFSFSSIEPGDYILRIVHYLHYPLKTKPFGVAPKRLLELSNLKLPRIEPDAPKSFNQMMEDQDWETIDIGPSTGGGVLNSK